MVYRAESFLEKYNVHKAPVKDYELDFAIKFETHMS